MDSGRRVDVWMEAESFLLAIQQQTKYQNCTSENTNIALTLYLQTSRS